MNKFPPRPHPQCLSSGVFCRFLNYLSNDCFIKEVCSHCPVKPEALADLSASVWNNALVFLTESS